MMLQYRRIKQQHKNEVLFFRMGDFYEMFEDDAKEISSLLDITLTQRSGIPMCGIPYHAAQNYIARLLKAGKKIAVCEQTHLPKPGQGLATREVVEVITPGTVVDENLLERNSNNFLAAIGQHGEHVSFAYIDLSTAEFYATSFSSENRIEKIKQELFGLSPREIIIQESLLEEDGELQSLLHEKDGLFLNRFPDWNFDLESSRRTLENQFGVSNLKGYGLDDEAPEIIAAGVILEYIQTTSRSLLPHLKELNVYRDSSYMGMDESTQRNLELIHNLQDGSRRYTLLEVLDYCRTSMGSRKLKRWILTPLMEREKIEARHERVEFFYRNQILLSNLREILGKILDMERLASKVAMDRAHAKNLLSIKSSLRGIRDIYRILEVFSELKPYLEDLEKKIPDIASLEELLERSIAEEPSILLTEGNLIRTGFNAELDRLRGMKENSRGILEKLLEEERKKTGIASLKLRYNRIIGYFFEITKSNLSLTPDYFIRRQSLVGSERFTSDSLTEIESDMTNASEQIIELEKRLFLDVRDTVKQNISLLIRTAEFIAEIDVLEAFAFSATVHGYCKPVLSEDTEIRILAGRHPVVEANLPSTAFVPNDVHLGGKAGKFMLLTGPNMAGKSTYLRQVALISLMAQIGSFVPAQEAHIGLSDMIFCRVGATDNLARGESTFLVEMNETANILRSASAKSLLIMDEIGRGTSTNDGLAIAWAVSEFILNEIKARTLFATHYHELTSLKHKNLLNLCMDVIEKDSEIIFLKKVKTGSSDNSYGIHVAQLAGLPESVTENARNILNKLAARIEAFQSKKYSEKEIPQQPGLFSPKDLLYNEIKGLNLDSMTPLEALNFLYRWKREAEEYLPPESNS
jgi:DNA mismatch repair protein MutS